MADTNTKSNKNVLAAVLLVLFFPVGLYLMWAKTDWNKKVKWGITAVFGVFLLIGIAGQGREAQSTSDQTTSQASNPTTTLTPTPTHNFQIYSNKDERTVQNIDVLISTAEDSEQNSKEIAFQVKKQCTKQCNILLYDNATAIDAWNAYMASPPDSPTSNEQWNQNHYKFIADHNVGNIEFEGNDYFYYPLKNDSEYQKYK
ncbi:MAG: hypothetical protein ACR2LN_01110 [Candidatus Levyibacteriota bacterium]